MRGRVLPSDDIDHKSFISLYNTQWNLGHELYLEHCVKFCLERWRLLERNIHTSVVRISTNASLQFEHVLDLVTV